MILLYHHIAPVSAVPHGSAPRDGWEWTHTPAALERHITELRRRGFRIAPLGEVVEAIRSNGTEPVGTAVLTFDDGWLDNYRYAVPVLARLNAPATFFVVTRHLRTNEADDARMSTTQLRNLHRRGYTVAAHTRTHPTLTSLGRDDLRDELAGSRQDLEELLQTEVRFLAYPGGAFDARVAEAARRSGFDAACCSIGPRRNRAGSLYWLHRNVLSERMNKLRDRYRLSPLATRLFERRVERRIAARLRGT